MHEGPQEPLRSHPGYLGGDVVAPEDPGLREGVHRPPVAGIAGKAKVGSQSIVLAGGYEDDEDNRGI